MTAQKLKKIVRWSTIITVVFIVFACLMISYQLIKIGTLKRRLAELDRQSASLTATTEQLEYGIEVRQTSSYVEQTAREQYGLSADGEKIFIEK